MVNLEIGLSHLDLVRIVGERAQHLNADVSVSRCVSSGADLVVTGLASVDLFDTSRAVNTSDLVMQLGRPVLVVPANADTLKLERALIGWKGTRETRRAVSDALPLLKKAAQVDVVAIVAEKELAAARTNLGIGPPERL